MPEPAEAAPQYPDRWECVSIISDTPCTSKQKQKIEVKINRNTASKKTNPKLKKGEKKPSFTPTKWPKYIQYTKNIRTSKCAVIRTLAMAPDKALDASPKPRPAALHRCSRALGCVGKAMQVHGANGTTSHSQVLIQSPTPSTQPGRTAPQRPRLGDPLRDGRWDGRSAAGPGPARPARRRGRSRGCALRWHRRPFPPPRAPPGPARRGEGAPYCLPAALGSAPPTGLRCILGGGWYFSSTAINRERQYGSNGRGGHRQHRVRRGTCFGNLTHKHTPPAPGLRVPSERGA